RRALELDGELRAFSDHHVYFVPPGDQFYYLGLAYQESGKLPEAASAFRSYLAEQPQSLYAERAREHLTELARLHEELPPTNGQIEITVNQSARDLDATRRAVNLTEGAMRACMARAGVARYVVDIDLSVRADGRVAGVHISRSSGNPGVEGCLATVSR